MNSLTFHLNSPTVVSEYPLRRMELMMVQVSVEDAFRAIVDAKWDVLSSGEIDSITGRFMVVEIPKHDNERAEMREAVFSEENRAVGEIFDRLEAGWFFVIHSSPDNLIYDLCKNRDYAFARFTLARAAYEEWADS